jgi:hypothetical protein
MSPGTWLDRESFSVRQLEILDAGARRCFGKSWSALVQDFSRIEKTPSADFTAAVLMVGALALLKQKESPAA